MNNKIVIIVISAILLVLMLLLLIYFISKTLEKNIKESWQMEALFECLILLSSQMISIEDKPYLRFLYLVITFAIIWTLKWLIGKGIMSKMFSKKESS